jgi:hypothetical protein
VCQHHKNDLQRAHLPDAAPPDLHRYIQDNVKCIYNASDATTSSKATHFESVPSPHRSPRHSRSPISDPLHHAPTQRSPALCVLLPVISAALSRRALNDPASEYPARMCSPFLSNILNDPVSLADSPFPCEQESYLGSVCIANGTAEIDFLAEQEW